MTFSRFAAGFVAAVVLTAASAPAMVRSPFAPAAPAAAFGANNVDSPASIAYCKSTGGAYEVRLPEYGTNNTKPLVLAGQAGFCHYTSKGKYPSSIYILVTSLYTPMPTLAVMAYKAKVKFNESSCPGGANPGSCYCTQLGGTDQFGGANLAGGAWVLPGASSASPNLDLEACIFPDLSSIDSFGLFYHSVGTIRGINLLTVVKYKGPA